MQDALSRTLTEGFPLRQRGARGVRLFASP